MNIELKTRKETKEKTIFKPLEFNTHEELQEYRKTHHIMSIEKRIQFVDDTRKEIKRQYYSTSEVIKHKEEMLITYFNIYKVVKKYMEYSNDGYSPIYLEDDDYTKYFYNEQEAKDYYKFIAGDELEVKEVITNIEKIN